MHENSFRPEEQEFNKNRDRFQQNFEDEMEEIFMDLRFLSANNLTDQRDGLNHMLTVPFRISTICCRFFQAPVQWDKRAGRVIL